MLPEGLGYLGREPLNSLLRIVSQLRKGEGGHSRQKDWQTHRHEFLSSSHLSCSQLGWGCQRERQERRAEGAGQTWRI